VRENQVRIGDRVFTDNEGDTPEQENSMARVIEDMLLTNHDIVEVVDGQKIDAASFVAAEQLPEQTQESLMDEVQAGFNMYRDTIAKRIFGRPVAELTAEELVKLDESIPFKFNRSEIDAEERVADELEATAEEEVEVVVEE
jgi:hypothetical protein